MTKPASNATPAAADAEPVDTSKAEAATKAAAAEFTAEEVADKVNAGGSIPAGWAYNREEGFFKPSAVIIGDSNEPVRVEV